MRAVRGGITGSWFSRYRNYRWGDSSSILAQTWPQKRSQSAWGSMPPDSPSFFTPQWPYQSKMAGSGPANTSLTRARRGNFEWLLQNSRTNPRNLRLGVTRSILTRSIATRSTLTRSTSHEINLPRDQLATRSTCHEINSHEINLPRDQGINLPRDQLSWDQLSWDQLVNSLMFCWTRVSWGKKMFWSIFELEITSIPQISAAVTMFCINKFLLLN